MLSTYAYDVDRHALVVFWNTGMGNAAFTVADLSQKVTGDQAQHLAHALTRLSKQAWRTYTHPASAAEDQSENSEGWRREHHREAFTTVADALTTPNLPSDGMLLHSHNPVEEAAQQAGRALHAAGDADLTARIVGEIQTEMNAVEQAELGDLTGRARQAVALTRAGASPAQVQAADRILSDHPLGSRALFTDVDPVAASIAAAHWLQAAADVAAETSGLAPTQIVEEADNIEALAHATPTAVLESLEVGLSPYDAITGMIREAMTAAEGKIPDIEAVRDCISQADELADEHQDPRLRDALLQTLRTTPLDPMRPAHDLLEDLLDGIRGCWLIYRESAETEEGADGPFADAVRAEANENQDRLT
jgi:hypothetical protein